MDPSIPYLLGFNDFFCEKMIDFYKNTRQSGPQRDERSRYSTADRFMPCRLCAYSKNDPKVIKDFLWVLKIGLKLGMGVQHFENCLVVFSDFCYQICNLGFVAK